MQRGSEQDKLAAIRILSVTTPAQLGVNVDRYVRHRIVAGAQPGQVYALALPYEVGSTLDGRYNNYLLSVTQATGDGSLIFKLPSPIRYLRYVSNVAATQLDFKRLATDQPTYTTPQVRGTAFVFALSGNFTDSTFGGRSAILKLSGTSDGR